MILGRNFPSVFPVSPCTVRIPDYAAMGWSTLISNSMPLKLPSPPPLPLRKGTSSSPQTKATPAFSKSLVSGPKPNSPPSVAPLPASMSLPSDTGDGGEAIQMTYIVECTCMIRKDQVNLRLLRRIRIWNGLDTRKYFRKDRDDFGT